MVAKLALSEEVKNYTMDRGLPASLEAERATLGAILLDNNTYHQAAEILKDGDFSLDSHRRIYKAMVELARSNRPMDFVTLTEVLGQHHELEAVGGSVYVMSLTDGLPRVKNIRHYVKIIKDKARLRKMIFAAGDAINSAYEGGQAIEVITKLQQGVIGLIMEQGHGAADKGAITHDILTTAYEVREGRREYTTITTSLPDLDELTGGVSDGEYIIIAARTSQGKSSLARQLALANARRFKQHGNGKRVVISTLEMTSKNYLECLISSMSGVNFSDIRDKRWLSNEDLDKMAKAAEEIDSLPLEIDDSSGLDGTELEARLLSYILQGAALIIVDFLQLVRWLAEREIRLKVSAVSAMLRDLAKRTKIPIIALSQLSRPGEKGEKMEEREPTIFDLKESGDIENDAFQVWLIHRPKKRNDQGRKMPTGEDKIIVGKNRNGPLGEVDVFYDGPVLTFRPRVVHVPTAVVTPTPIQPSFYERENDDYREND